MSYVIHDRLLEEAMKAKTANDWVSLGLYAFAHEEYIESVKYLNLALEIDSQNPQLYVHRADAHLACDEIDEAFNDYEMAVFYGGGKEIQKMRSTLKIQYDLEKELDRKEFESIENRD